MPPSHPLGERARRPLSSSFLVLHHAPNLLLDMQGLAKDPLISASGRRRCFAMVHDERRPSLSPSSYGARWSKVSCRACAPRLGEDLGEVGLRFRLTTIHRRS
jgi:hypothetical protein